MPFASVRGTPRGTARAAAQQAPTRGPRIKTMSADDARRALLAAFNLGWQQPRAEADGT